MRPDDEAAVRLAPIAGDLARNLFGATPAEAVRSVVDLISRRIVSAVSVAVGMPVSSTVTSR